MKEISVLRTKTNGFAMWRLKLRNHRFAMLTGLGVLLTCATVILGVRAFDSGLARPSGRGEPPARSGEETANSALTITTADNEPLQVEQLKITKFGFQPSEIKRAAKPFLFAIDSSVGEVHLRLNNAVGTLVRQRSMAPEKRRLREMYDLAPGDYVLTDDNHPDWTCTISIAPAQ